MTVAIAPGTTFAGYRVQSVIGRGGMGVVYRAWDLSLERPVALKVIAPELAGDERFRARFLKEPRLAASLDHANVVPIYEAGEADGQLYLAMRFVEGSDLRTLLKGGLRVERLLSILAQVAGALDAAHRRGLVHRDVKPANVLLDEDGHAYLTDFGITKQLGADSTETGQLVGTLDYIAPEQIRGEGVDGRSDCYSLACVLYEGLTGAPPFRRPTEAETLWAHMQEPPPPLPDSALDTVLQRALAKESDERYPICAELIEAARGALGLTSPPPSLLARPALLRRRHAILAAGLVTLAAAIAAGGVALTSGGEGSHVSQPAANGVAAIDAATSRLASLTEAETAPSNVAVGEGAVWVLNTEDRNISRIDPKTKTVVKRFEIGGVPSDIAAGAGALWVGRGGGHSNNGTVSISRVDPASTRVTRTVRLPESKGDSRWPSTGFPGIAVGEGAVWAINPDQTISRIDPETGRIVAQVDANATTIAAGDAGVWFVAADRPAVARIDPRTNRVGQTIPVGANVLFGIAVGGGSVWATGENEGLVWRIDPGPHPVTRSIETGPGVSYIAFADGIVWAANFIDGKVSRIDPRKNAVTTQVPIGASQALAAGAGSAWVSVAGAASNGALSPSSCADVVSGGGTPDVLIASDLPLQGPNSAGARAMADAIGLVFKRHGFRAGTYAVGYQSCDASTAQSGAFEFRKCAANANPYARAKALVAVIGPFNSQCAAVEMPILNRAPGGPLAMISPSNTYPGLTRSVSVPAAWGGYRNEPDVFYPTGARHYVRLGAGDDFTGVAHAVLAKRLGLKSIYLLPDNRGLFDVFVTDSFRRAARKLGVRIAGATTYDPATKSYDALAEKVARSGAQGVVIGGDVYEGGDRMLKALRARLGPRFPIMSGFGFTPISDVLKRAGRAARGLYVSLAETPGAAHRTPAARRFARELGTMEPLPFVLEAGQAAELVLQAIARSDGTRASVLRGLRAAKVRDGILGSFRFDRNGDITPATVTIVRITGATPPDSGLDRNLQGAVVDSIVKVPASLAN